MFDGTWLTFTQTCTIRRCTETTDATNRKIKGSYSNSSTNVRCRLYTKTGREIQDTKAVVVSFFVLHMPLGTDIRIKDQILLETKTYLVDNINPNPQTGNHHLEVDLSLVE